MRARVAVLSTIAVALLLTAGPAFALETKPTSPPTPPDGTVVSPPQDPYVEAVRYAGGNRDQTPDPGERLQVFFSLRNTTDHVLHDVTATLTVKGDIAVVDGTSSWPDIAPGELAQATTPFVIQISDAAARATPCTGGLEILPAPGTPVPVASDVAGGNTGSGSAPSSSGSAEPAATGTVEPDATVTAVPTTVEPAPPSSTQPEPGSSIEPVPVEPPADAPVPFDAALVVHTSGGSFDAGFGSGIACPLAMEGGTASGHTNGTTQGAPKVQPVAADTSRTTPKTSSSLPPLLVVLIAAAGALVARYRFTA